MVRRKLVLSGHETERNWRKVPAESRLNGAARRLVTQEERELSRLLSENLRLKWGGGQNSKKSDVVVRKRLSLL